MLGAIQLKTSIMQTTATNNKTKWKIDQSYSMITFKIKHLMISNVSGLFKEFGGSIYTTDEDFISSEIDCWINPASIDTGDPKRDEHIKGPDFFDAANYPQIIFTGNTYEKADTWGTYELYGELTIKGISKQIKLMVEFGGVVTDPWGNHKAGFTISGTINRKEWGLNWDTPLDNGVIFLNDAVKISCEVQLIKQV